MAWRDKAPIVSWLALLGRCRRCRKRYGAEHLVVELSGAGVALAFAMLSESWTEAIRGGLFFGLLAGIAVSDARSYIIPDGFSLGGTVLGLAFSFFAGGLAPTGAAAGAVFGFVLLWIVRVAGDRILGKPSMGGGDVKMMAMVGAFLGMKGVLATLMMGALAGLIVYGPIALRSARPVPFGTFLAIAAAIAFVWGSDLTAWYLELLGAG